MFLDGPGGNVGSRIGIGLEGEDVLEVRFLGGPEPYPHADIHGKFILGKL